MLVALSTADSPAAWAALGFGDPIRVGPLTVSCDGGTGWTLVRGSLPAPDQVDGIPTRWVDEPGDDRGDLDHVVIVTDSLDRTVDALVVVGGDERRRADVGRGRMAFVRMGRVIVEVVQRGDAVRIWGLVAVREDLSALPAAFVGEVADAVQPGRRIVTARPQPGLRTAVAFMTPRVRTR